MILRLPWAELKWYFITNRGPKQGVTRNIVTLKVDCQKISIQEQFQNKLEKVNFFNYISSTKKKIRTIQGIPESLDTLELSVWNYMHPPPPPVICFASSYLRNSTPSLLPPPANKCKFEIFQSPISIEGVYTMHLMLPIYVEYFWSSSLLSCNKDSEGFSK